MNHPGRQGLKFTGKQPWQSFIFNKAADLRPATVLKMGLWHWCFLVNFEKFLRTPFLQNTSGRLLNWQICEDGLLKESSHAHVKFKKNGTRLPDMLALKGHARKQ